MRRPLYKITGSTVEKPVMLTRSIYTQKKIINGVKDGLWLTKEKCGRRRGMKRDESFEEGKDRFKKAEEMRLRKTKSLALRSCMAIRNGDVVICNERKVEGLRSGNVSFWRTRTGVAKTLFTELNSGTLSHQGNLQRSIPWQATVTYKWGKAFLRTWYRISN